MARRMLILGADKSSVLSRWNQLQYVYHGRITLTVQEAWHVHGMYPVLQTREEVN